MLHSGPGYTTDLSYWAIHPLVSSFYLTKEDGSLLESYEDDPVITYAEVYLCEALVYKMLYMTQFVGILHS